MVRPGQNLAAWLAAGRIETAAVEGDANWSDQLGELAPARLAAAQRLGVDTLLNLEGDDASITAVVVARHTAHPQNECCRASQLQAHYSHHNEYGTAFGTTI